MMNIIHCRVAVIEPCPGLEIQTIDFYYDLYFQMVAEKYETFTDSSRVKGTQPATCSPLLPGNVNGKTYQGRYSVYPPSTW